MTELCHGGTKHAVEEEVDPRTRKVYYVNLTAPVIPARSEDKVALWARLSSLPRYLELKNGSIKGKNTTSSEITSVLFLLESS